MGKTKSQKLKATEDFDNFKSDEVNLKWFEQVVDHQNDFKPVTGEILSQLMHEAKKCHDAALADYNIENTRTNPNYKWMKTVISKGIVSDKIAACTITIQDNPVCSLETLQNLISMVKVGKKKECTLVIDTLTELFLADLLRPDKKLKPFSQQPLLLLNDLCSGNAVSRRKILSVWYFEDQLKHLYHNFILALNNVAHDVLDNNKEKAISAMFKLLLGNPEQEKNLLRNLVNKLGDPSKKIASKTIYNFSQLLFKHPNMQGVVLNEIEKLLFRTNISQKTQYYGLCFLSQFHLNHESSEIARRLIEVYFSFFKACIKKGDVDSRMMSALLMGVNRAHPYAKMELQKISDHVDTMYRVVHIANFNNSLHALTLLYQISDNKSSMSDRFYAALYKKLIDPALLTTTHQALLLSLVYKALSRDTDIERVKAFIKRLLQLALFMQPSMACGVLYVISQLLGKKIVTQALILKQSSISEIEDDDEEKYHDVQTYDMIAIKEEDERIELEVTSVQNSDDVAVEIKVKDAEDVNTNDSDVNNSSSGPSWNHRAFFQKKHNKLCRYNPLSRNPSYVGTDFCAYNELLQLKYHHHPTVALYANRILQGILVKYSGDPLKDFTLIRFLDRFVFKNPKKYEEIKGVNPTFGKRKMYNPRGTKSLSLNSANYLKENTKDIPVDELFVYRYLRQKYDRNATESKNEDDGDETDMESVQSEEFEEMLDKMSGYPNDENIDFLNGIGDNLKTKSKKRGSYDNEDEAEYGFLDNDDLQEHEDIESHLEDDLSDVDSLEMTEDDKDLLEDVDRDDGESEEIVFENNRNFQDCRFPKKKKFNDLNALFASAEEFSALLEDEGSSKTAPGGSNVFRNKECASNKQIAWEETRNTWMSGFKKAISKQNYPKESSNFLKRKKLNNFENNPRKRKNKL